MIAIGAERLTSFWQFTVVDNGPGVPAGARERIFKMFSRGSSAEQAGHGMGLALCRRIVESYGGTIWVEANPGSGSRFCFTLPAWHNAMAKRRSVLADQPHYTEPPADATRRIAVGLNDDVVQALVAAEMAFDLGRLDTARAALAEASLAARAWVGVQLLAAGEPRPGSFVRTRPSAAITDGASG